MLDAFRTGLVEQGDEPLAQIEWLRHRGIAQAMLDHADESNQTLSS